MNILIVDDSDSILALIATIVDELGYDNISASSGEEAVETVKNIDRLPDLVILDVNMTGINGYETAKQLKDIADTNHLPIIFLTGARDPDIQAKCLSIGDDYIAKPFSVEMVIIKIKAHLRVSQLTTKMQEKNLELKRRDQAVKNEHRIVETIFANQFKKHISLSQHINYHMSPVSVFNGDVLLTATGPANNFYVLIGDVTGHGLPAAVGAIPIYSAFRTMAAKGLTVGAIAAEVNKSLLQLLPAHMMMAAAILEINTHSDQLMVWSGGMPSLIIDDGQGNIKQRIHAIHPPLAAVDELEFSQNIELYDIETNDRMYLFTDGIEESRNHKDHMFSEERLLRLFDGQQKNMFERILSALEAFTRNAQQDDDITLVEFSYQPESSFIAKDPLNTPLPKLLPWEMNFNLDIDHIKKTDPIPQIIRLLENANGIDVHQDFISTILSELYNNALEHGLLNLDSSIKKDDLGFIDYYQQRRKKLAALKQGKISIHLACEPSKTGGDMSISVTDNGPGFNVDEVATVDDNNHFGRGLRLTQELCEEVNVLDNGRCVQVRYPLQR